MTLYNSDIYGILNNNENISDDIINYIEKRIGLDILNGNDDLLKAVYLYYVTGEIFGFNSDYFINADIFHDEFFPISSIDLSNNKVTCYQWSIIYKKLLDKYVKKSHASINIDGDGHACVVFYYDGIKLWADMVRDDLFNIRFGFPIKRIRIDKYLVENFNGNGKIQIVFDKLSECINSVYDKFGIKVVNRDEFEKNFFSKIFSSLKRNREKRFCNGEIGKYEIDRKEISKRILAANRLYGLKVGENFYSERENFFDVFGGNVFKCNSVNDRYCIGRSYSFPYIDGVNNRYIKLLAFQTMSNYRDRRSIGDTVYYLENVFPNRKPGFYEISKNDLINFIINSELNIENNMFRCDGYVNLPNGINSILGFNDSDKELIGKYARSLKSKRVLR